MNVTMRTLLLALAMLGVLLAPPGEAHAQPGRMGINGLTVGDDGSVPSRAAIQALARAGAAWVRVEFKTGPFGGTDSAAFYQAYDELVDGYRAEGVQVLGLVDNVTLPGDPGQWQDNAYETTGGNGNNDYLRGLATMSARIAAHFQGRMSHLEVWNEPNAPNTYLHPSNFAALLTETYAMTKIYNQIDVQLVSGGLHAHSLYGLNCDSAGAAYLRQTYAAGIATGTFLWARERIGGWPLDVIGQHPYLRHDGWLSAGEMHYYLDCLHQAYAEQGDGWKPIWATEFGWRSDYVGESVQAANIRTAFAAFHDSPYVQNALLFTHVDFFEPYGIWYGWCNLADPGAEPGCRKPEPYAAFTESVD